MHRNDWLSVGYSLALKARNTQPKTPVPEQPRQGFESMPLMPLMNKTSPYCWQRFKKKTHFIKR